NPAGLRRRAICGLFPLDLRSAPLLLSPNPDADGTPANDTTMALLHYENLNLHRPEIVLRQVDHGLRDVAGYLSRSIVSPKSHPVPHPSWPALEPAPVTDLSSEERATGVCTELDDPPGARNDGDDSLAAFVDDGVPI